MVIFFDPKCVDYHRAGDPEQPARIARTVPLLREKHPDWSWVEPAPATDEELLRAHSLEHVQQVRSPTGDFDTDTPAHRNVDQYARAAAGAAIAAARQSLGGDKTFSLMRPPGHHATRDRAMGFCYFSNVAVAALDALESGMGFQPMSGKPSAGSRCHRVAIWDFDAHHGNGTEYIVAEDERIAFASIHQSPGYPGTGLRSFANVHNYPIAPYASRQLHMSAIEEALQKLLDFKPDLLLVSAGFDAYSGDPITQMTLEMDDFATMGKWLARLKIPVAAILEGGYSDELPQLIDAFLKGWTSEKR